MCYECKLELRDYSLVGKEGNVILLKKEFCPICGEKL